MAGSATKLRRAAHKGSKAPVRSSGNGAKKKFFTRPDTSLSGFDVLRLQASSLNKLMPFKEQKRHFLLNPVVGPDRINTLLADHPGITKSIQTTAGSLLDEENERPKQLEFPLDRWQPAGAVRKTERAGAAKGKEHYDLRHEHAVPDHTDVSVAWGGAFIIVAGGDNNE